MLRCHDQRKQLIKEEFNWAYASGELESMMTEWRPSDRGLEQQLRARALIQKRRQREGTLGMAWVFWNFRTPTVTLPPTRSYLLILPKQFHKLGPSIQTYVPRGIILIQTTTSKYSLRSPLHFSLPARYDHTAISVTEYHMTWLLVLLRQARAALAPPGSSLPNSGGSSLFLWWAKWEIG